MAPAWMLILMFYGASAPTPTWISEMAHFETRAACEHAKVDILAEHAKMGTASKALGFIGRPSPLVALCEPLGDAK